MTNNKQRIMWNEKWTNESSLKSVISLANNILGPYFIQYPLPAISTSYCSKSIVTSYTLHNNRRCFECDMHQTISTGAKNFSTQKLNVNTKTHTELNVSCNIETNENKLWFCFAWKMSNLVVYTLLSRKLRGDIICGSP